MPKNRVILSFSATPGGPFGSNAGWTETLWNNQNVAPESLLISIAGAPATPPTIPYLDDRRQLLTSGWRIDSLKIYPITGGRLVAERTFPAATMRGLDVPAGDQTEQQPYDRLLWKMNAAGGRSRVCRLGGIMSSVVDPGGNYVAEVGDFGWANTFINTFLPNLVTAQFGVRYSTVGDPQQITNVVVDGTAIVGASPRTPVIQVAGAQSAVFPAGSTVRISGQETPARLNGQWTVGAVAVVGLVTNITLRAKRSLQIAGDFHAGGYIRSVAYDVAAMTSGSPVRGVSRRVGRPSGLPRGRRSRRTS